METITGRATAHTLMQNIEVNWTLDAEGNVTANGETGGRVIESLPGLVYAFPADGRDWEASFCSAVEAAAALAALHVRRAVKFVGLGMAAHANDEHRAPALNAQVMEALAGRKVGDPGNLRIMTDFTKGYDMAIRAELNAPPAA